MAKLIFGVLLKIHAHDHLVTKLIK